MNGHRSRLVPIISLLSFVLSSVIDNLTATIVAVKILRHLSPYDRDWRHTCGGLAVVAANAGGAWSPIGDVTTTMLWIQNKISTTNTVAWLFVPSCVAGFVPLAGVWWQEVRQQKAATKQHGIPSSLPSRKSLTEENLCKPVRSASASSAKSAEETPQPKVTAGKVAALVLGMLCIVFVPALKMMTGLPPYIGMLLALGMYWIITDLFDFERLCSDTREKDASSASALIEASEGEHSGVIKALHHVDLTGLLFFAGVLLSVVALDAAGVLHRYAHALSDLFGDNVALLCATLGASSAVVDNVPLVEAAIEMFEETPMDHPLWQLVALAAGTGGSMLSVGSIAGVTLMGMEGVGFLWYLKHISGWAVLGFTLSILCYELERSLYNSYWLQ